MEVTALVNFSYLAAVILLIVGLRGLSSPATARRGNFMAAGGMGLAILTSLLQPVESGQNNYLIIMIALAIGTGIGLVVSKKVEMTAMPELVSLFNGLGGACAVAIALIELYNYQPIFIAGDTVALGKHLTTHLAMFVGGVAFTGSLVAYGKLAGKIKDRKIPGLQWVNIAALVVLLGLIVFRSLAPDVSFVLPLVILIASLFYGITFVQPIGGADMPVVISLLNAFTGVAAALAGIVYGNQAMLVGGILVGSSGTILTVLMCQAMNRSLLNVIIGGFGGGGTAIAAGEQVIRETNAAEVAILLRYAQQVIFIPGYGMAVAQAQKTCKELDDVLQKHNVNVKYAIHPVAGRMPGHMNVLLAEADVPYPSLLDLDDANAAFKETDVCIVVGANDVVNPAALDDPASPIYGMPILEILQAKKNIVMKRSMNFGYSGIQNPLFFHERTNMLFGDAKKSIESLVSEVKALD
ncbi:MAG: NAD(P)(+) transhydrogenase (Re/Si-specific) subunit beta [Bacteroidota bacterium]